MRGKRGGGRKKGKRGRGNDRKRDPEKRGRGEMRGDGERVCEFVRERVEGGRRGGKI